MIREAVRAWREEKCAELCPQCPMNCCQGRLNPRLDSLEAFADLPRVRRVTDPRPLDGPYVSDRRFLLWGACYLAGRCPHLTEELRCDIYGQASRPRECVEYPLHVQRVPGGQVISAETSCWIFQREENRESARSLARQAGVEVVFHPPPTTVKL